MKTPTQVTVSPASLLPSLAVPEVQELRVPWFDLGRASVSILRADQNDPLLSGNKYYKLRHNLAAARAAGHETLLSFGGAWSNHLHALAAAGSRFGFRTVGVVRGHATAPLTPCLEDAAGFGMQLHFIGREDYRRRGDPLFMQELQQILGPAWTIPEGGANLQGVRGCQELLPAAVAARFTHVVLACGTGTTMLGLVSSIATPVLGIQVLKGDGYLQRELANALQRHSLQATAPWQVFDQFHRGGYGKVDAHLLDFMHRFERESGVPLEPVYIGKTLLALHELLGAGVLPDGARVLVVHGGGLQGRRGYP